MFARLKKLASQKPRQLITSCMFGAYIALTATNVIVNRNALTAVDIGLLVPAITTLGMAVAHSIVRSIHAVIHDNDHTEIEEEQSNNLLCMRPSSHNIINAALHMTSSSTFITFDALLLAGVTTIPASTPYPAAITRVTGSGIWFSAALLNLLTAITRDRNNENHPDEAHNPLGIAPETFNLTNEILYLMAAVCYAYALYAENPINPYKAAANSLWLLAGSIGTTAAVYDYTHRNKEPAAVSDQAAIDVVIELPESTESNSSEVVIEAPGMGM